MLIPGDRAVLDMKTQRDKLQQYQKRITVITARETSVAKECLARGDKPKALVALRRKKYQESLLQKTDQQLAQLEVLVGDVEFALVQKDVVFGLQQGTKVLKEIHKEMGGVDAVEKLLEETAEAQEYEREVSEMLAGRMTNAEEDEVEDELAALEREVNRPNIEGKLPQAPINDLPAQTHKHTEEKGREQQAMEASARQAEQREAILA